MAEPHNASGLTAPFKTGFREWMAELHYRPADVLPLWLHGLQPFAALYGLGVSARLTAYEQGWLQAVASDVPVISVGNLTTGGTGKTPVVIALADGLIRAGKRVLVLSRGYGAAEPVACGRAGDPRNGDEACLIQEQVPEAVVMVGRDRVRTLQAALTPSITERRPDYVILDDGFQYVRLRREMNLLLMDGEALIGNGRLLPMGPLREPLSQIRRADAVFITRHVSPEARQTVERWVHRHHPTPESVPVLSVPFRVTGLRPVESRETLPAEAFAGRPAIAVSGIARPGSFERDLREAGLRLLAHRRFPDHYVYTGTDVRELLNLQNRYSGENPVFITTEKDWPKIRACFPAGRREALAAFHTLQIRPAFDGRWFYEEFLTPLPHRFAPEETSPQTGSRHGL
jgi:tetraacyldisaccharide 4'-kinase